VIGGTAALIPLIPKLRGASFRVTTILKKDHRMATGLLKMLEKAPKANTRLRRALMDRIHREFLAHETAEDDVLYQMIRNRGMTAAGPQVEQAYREQDQIRDMLYRFDKIDPMNEEFSSRLRELIDAIERHSEREERYVFPYIETLLTKEEQEGLGRQLHAAKNEWKEHLSAA
jgi:hemerythrin-like domain-containing protein